MKLQKTTTSKDSGSHHDTPIQTHKSTADLSAFGIHSQRNDILTQRKLNTLMTQRATESSLIQQQNAIKNSARATLQRKEIEDLKNSQLPIQKKEAPNLTGMPDKLKTGLEKLSGHDMSDVRVHYNSAKPAQLNAHAYAQGTNIHIAPGQEKHLPHEAWHTVQQKQNRVQPTMQAHGVSINDSKSLEREADVMGAKALNH